MRALALAAVGLALTGCDPNWIETSAEVDMYISQGRWRAVCVALDNDRDDKLRQYTAEKIAQESNDETATTCACEAVTKWKHGPYDAAVVEGFSGSHRDDLASCVIPVLGSVTGEDRVRLTTQLANLGSPSSIAKVAELAVDESEDAAVRKAAVVGLLPYRDDHTDLLLGRMKSDPDAAVRAEAAALFENVSDQPVVDALVTAARGDEDGGVRAAALKAVVKLKLEETDAMVCDLMMNDPDERVRDRAVRSFKGSKRREALDCLKKRLLTKEESPKVRESTMVALYASPDPYGPKILCDAVGPFVRMYYGDVDYHKLSGVDIMKHQNNRDFDNSYDCVQKARRSGGHSCWGKYYLAVWTNDLGGKAHKPTCKGMEPAVIAFE